jgi:cystathionine beta-lyase
MILMDLEALGKLGKERNVMTAVDSTFGSPYNQNPLQYGIDIVIHSGTLKRSLPSPPSTATKYLGGHSDIIAGTITSKSTDIHKQMIQSVQFNSSTINNQRSYY